MTATSYVNAGSSHRPAHEIHAHRLQEANARRRKEALEPGANLRCDLIGVSVVRMRDAHDLLHEVVVVAEITRSQEFAPLDGLEDSRMPRALQRFQSLLPHCALVVE